ncbi:MAG: hypothetical protein JXB88_13330 [Spirochaetales bacterium]|nr:hypothetical protein [Spirochaetales bacterium]
MKALLIVCLICLSLFPLKADDFYRELERLGNDWFAFYEIIKDLDITNEDEVLPASLDDFTFILSDTMLFVDEQLKQPIADAELSGYLEILRMNIDLLFDLEDSDEQEMLNILKDMARTFFNLCEHCGIHPGE